MKPTKESYETAVKFAKTIDCDIVKYGCQYGEWLAYFVGVNMANGWHTLSVPKTLWTLSVVTL